MLKLHVEIINVCYKKCRISSCYPHHSPSHHRVDSVMESSLRNIIFSKNFALINLSLNFCETTIYDNKVFIENLVACINSI